MSDVVVDITMSLDGYVTASDDSPAHGLGVQGEVLHYWVFGGPWSVDEPREMKPIGVDKDALETAIASGGASIVGRRMYDITGGWGGQSPFGVPTIVVTHRTSDAPDPSSGFVFIDGIEAALAKAREAAGDKDICIGGGASVIQQAFHAGMVDRLRLHVAPVVLGAGRPLFGELGKRIVFEPIRSSDSAYAAHLEYRVVR